MKTIDIFNWFVVNSINGEFLSIIDVPEEASDEWWEFRFVSHPKQKVVKGTYLYYYASQICDDIKDEFGNVIEPDAKIEICNTDDMYDYDVVLLYKME